IAPPPTIAISAPSPSASAAAPNSGGAPAPANYQAPQSPQSQAALEAWKAAAVAIAGMLGDFASLAVRVECQSPEKWTIVFPAGSSKSVEYIEQPARRAEIQAALDTAAGRAIQFTFRVLSGPVERKTTEQPVSAAVVRSQRIRQLAEHPYVSKLCELVQGEIVRVDPPQETPPAPAPAPQSTSPPATTPQSRPEVSAANAH
ncbi:MAG: hypothetical protein ACTHK7_05520, partial [Aureliella sp.]